QTLTGHRDGITRVIYSADCTMLASSSRDKTVKLWRLPTTVGCDHPQVRPYSLSSLWPFQAHIPELVSTLSRHSTQVTKVAFNPTNSMELATAGFDQRVLIWTLPQGLNDDALNTLVKDGCRATQDFLTMATHPDLFGVSRDSSTHGNSLSAIQSFCAKR
ncbi:MAG TPA: hypothetical protein IGR64_11720, partial [Leptolyngbyaceae cyanobacterium M65_K2018_010]|nr:hypothetical protein [Leptolyngbyaceae cyanobacterium M65_K2018_010]